MFHHIGDPPAGAQEADPTIEDAYLLLLETYGAARDAA